MDFSKLNPPFRKSSENYDYSRLIREDCEIKFKIDKNEFDSTVRKTRHFIESPIFPEDRHSHFEWSIKVYPVGDVEKTAGNVSIYLYLKRKNTHLSASTVFRFYMETESNSILRSWNAKHIFQTCNIGNGFSTFYESKKLIESCTGNSVFVGAQISAQYEADNCFIYDYPAQKNLTNNYSSLLESGEYSDVDICTDQDETAFKVHRNILASRSTVFAAMLKNEMKENATGRIVIKDLPSSTVKDLLNFVYSCEVNFKNAEATLDLLRASDKYDIMDLKLQCAEYLLTVIDENNACRILLEADMYNSLDLKTAALKYICCRKDQISKTNQFKIISEKNPNLLVEIIEKLPQYVEDNKLNDISIK